MLRLAVPRGGSGDSGVIVAACHSDCPQKMTTLIATSGGAVKAGGSLDRFVLRPCRSWNEPALGVVLGGPPVWRAEFVLQEAMPGLTTRMIVTMAGSADAGRLPWARNRAGSAARVSGRPRSE